MSELAALHRQFRRNMHVVLERDGIHSTVHAHNYFSVLFPDEVIPARLELTLYDERGRAVGEHAETLGPHESRFVEMEPLLPPACRGRHAGTVTFRIVPLSPLPPGAKKNDNEYGSEMFMMYWDAAGHRSVSHSFWGVVETVSRTARYIRAVPTGDELSTALILQSGYWGDNALFTRYARGTLDLTNARGERRRFRIPKIPPRGTYVFDVAEHVQDLEAFSGSQYLTADVHGENLYMKPVMVTRNRRTGDFNVHHT